jgi:hypothetical protein
MFGKNSRESKNPEKAKERAKEQILTLDKFRRGFALTAGHTGEAAQEKYWGYTKQMEEIAAANGLTIESVLDPETEPAETVEKLVSAESAEKAPAEVSEKISAQAKLEINLLKDEYGRTRKSLAGLGEGVDKTARGALQEKLATLEDRVHKLAIENGLAVPEMMATLKEVTPEDLKKLGNEEIAKLKAVWEMHEIEAVMGAPENRDKFYELRDMARNIIERYNLDASHLEKFEIPKLSPETEKKLAEVPKEELEEIKHAIAIRENAPVEKRGFFKKLFGIGSREEKLKKKEQAEQNAIVESIGGYIEKYEELVPFLQNADPSSALASDLRRIIKTIETKAYEAIQNYKGDISTIELGPFKSFVGAPAVEAAPVAIETPVAKPSVIETAAQNIAERRANLLNKMRGVMNSYVMRVVLAASTLLPMKTFDQKSVETKQETKTEIAYAAPQKKAAEIILETPAPKKHWVEQAKEARDSARNEMSETPLAANVDTSGQMESEYSAAAGNRGPGLGTVLGTTPASLDGHYKYRSPVAPEVGATYAYGHGPDDMTPSEIEDATPRRGKMKVTYQNEKGQEVNEKELSKKKIEYVWNPGTPEQMHAQDEEKRTGVKQTPAKSKETVKKVSEKKALEQAPKIIPTEDSIEREEAVAIPRYTPLDSIPVVGDASQGMNLPVGAWKFDWKPESVTPGYFRVVRQDPTHIQAINNEFQLMDPEAINVEGYTLPHSFHVRTDPTVWKALASTPSALQKYVEMAMKPNSHGTYPITVWEGNVGMEYIIGANDYLATSPRVVTRTSETSTTLSKEEQRILSLLCKPHKGKDAPVYWLTKGTGGYSAQEQINNVIEFIWQTQLVTAQKIRIEYKTPGSADYRKENDFKFIYAEAPVKYEKEPKYATPALKKTTPSKQDKAKNRETTNRIGGRTTSGPEKEIKKIPLKGFKVFNYREKSRADSANTRLTSPL